MEKCDDICLNQRIIQRFFAYSIYDLFSKYFKISNNNNNNNQYNIGNNMGNIENNPWKKTVSFLTNYTERYNKLKV